jgi:hypothetical protein
MINGTTSILKSYIFQICAAIYQLLLHIVFTSHNWFVMQGPVAIILISWNVIFIWERGYWTRAIKRFALFDLLKSLYFDTKILSKYIPSLQKRLKTMDFHIVKMYKDKVVNKNVKDIFLSMCDIKVSLTFTSLSLVLFWQLFYLFCSSIVINTVIVTAGNFEP